ELDVLRSTRQLKTSCFFPNLPGYSHIETSRMKNSHVVFVAPNSAGCKGTSHGIANCFLNGRERFMRCIRTTKRVPPIVFQTADNLLKIVIGYNNIRIKDNKVITFCTSETIVSRKTLALIFFKVIMDLKAIRK